VHLQHTSLSLVGTSSGVRSLEMSAQASGRATVGRNTTKARGRRRRIGLTAYYIY